MTTESLAGRKQRLEEAAPDMLAALRLHKAWSYSEDKGPDYGGLSRDTHPDGEAIWRRWWEGNLDLCDRAQKATDAAVAKAEGRTAAAEADDDDDYHRPDESGYSRADEEWFFGMDGKP
ncbi:MULTISPECIES: hypothetical protein [unclassified Aurantimonas]|uniref:hypothetical protein n=1 Tax=unclassified Aurantimonas TaxID=2638230 RepID=UPI002E17CEF5|nr:MULTISPECIES: hypothetical protein [unclassified Aurantimonas]MEC5289432.1 hypothetical protein [Aurantimonas sp. C2-3-R2]MEC5410512.1 hypothetical protein [Aurantimonas sp. C2-4-R8]